MPDLSGRLNIEPLSPNHLPELLQIQQQAPESARWPAAAYLTYETLAATLDGRLAGFLTYRQVAPDEMEILDLAVHRAFRRRGIASALLGRALQDYCGQVYLEVRTGNSAAIAFYSVFGFQPAGIRTKYYPDSREDAVVMRLKSC